MATFGTFTAGQVLTASELNGGGAYTNISSTQAFAGFTKGNATVVSKYMKFNKFVHFWGGVTLGSTSVMNGPALDVTLPFTATGGVLTNESNCMFYNNAAVYWGVGLHINTTALRLVAMNVAGVYAVNADVNATVPFTWANTHSFYWNHIYEAA
jgi:hypothetical protein